MVEDLEHTEHTEVGNKVEGFHSVVGKNCSGTG
jgi:hypothetical protein